jgi:hypothetical protein
VIGGPGGRVLAVRPPSITRRQSMLWTILVIVVVVLAVIGLLSVLRGRA